MILTAARGRPYPLLVAFFRPIPIHPIEAANLRPSPEATMAHALHLQQAYRRTLGRVRATIRAIWSAVTAEHTLALRAATKAALPRQSLAEVRAMYVSPQESRQEGDAVAQSTKSETPDRDDLVTADVRKARNARGTHPWVRFAPEPWDTGRPLREEITWHLDRGQSHRSTRSDRA